MPRSPSSKASVQKLLDFLNLYNRVEGTPGFSTTALGLSRTDVGRILLEQQDEHPLRFVEQQQLHFRYPIHRHLRGGLTAHSLSTHLAVIDEVTTWALVLADPVRSRAGVSVHLQARWCGGPARHGMFLAPHYVDITSTVTKIGHKLGFVRAEIFNAGERIGYGSHIKYLPMGFVTDFALSRRGWGLAQWYAQHWLPEPTPQYDHDDAKFKDLFESFQVVKDVGDDNDAPSDGTLMASFQPTESHASLGGALHGGCHAVLMERAADAYLQQQHSSSKLPPLQLDAMSVEYLASPSAQHAVGLRIAETIAGSSRNSKDVTLRVQLLDQVDGRTKSEGLLHYVVSAAAELVPPPTNQ